MTTGETPDRRDAARTAAPSVTDIRGDVVWLPEGTLPAEVWVFIAGRTGMMVKRAAVGAEGYVLDHYDRAGAAGAPRRRRRAAARRAARHAAGDDLLRQPRGVRLRLDARPAAPSSAGAAATICGRTSARSSPAPDARGDRRAPGLGPHARRALRRALPGAARRVDARPRLEAPHPGLRHSAGDAVEQPPRRSHRRRRRAVEDDHAGALGVVGQPPVRPRRSPRPRPGPGCTRRRSRRRRSISRPRPIGTS